MHIKCTARSKRIPQLCTPSCGAKQFLISNSSHLAAAAVPPQKPWINTLGMASATATSAACCATRAAASRFRLLGAAALALRSAASAFTSASSTARWAWRHGAHTNENMLEEL